jgi:hypothetical protein
MYTRLYIAAAAFAVIAGPLTAQTFQRRAEIAGGGYSDRGKCTVEVVVDGAAEVEIRGDNGTVRNLSGQPAQWRRFQCTGVLPANPAEFRFAVLEGRGHQQLVRDPRNGGVAVVRIEDPEGGAQAYAFEVTWGGGAPPPVVQDRGRPDQRENRPYPDPADQRDRTWDRGQVNRRYTADQAIRICQDNVRQQATARFRTNSSNVTFQRTAIDDNPGRNDWVMGTFSVRRGYRGQETHRFACSVNFDNGQVRSATIDPQDGGRGAQDNQGAGRAIQNCQRAVEERIRRDGYDRVNFGSINVDDRRNDLIVGYARADGRDGGAAFSFSCSVDLRDGDVRSVDVTRR